MSYIFEMLKSCLRVSPLSQRLCVKKCLLQK